MGSTKGIIMAQAYDDPSIPEILRSQICQDVTDLQNDPGLIQFAKVNHKDKLPIVFREPVRRCFARHWLPDDVMFRKDVLDWLNNIESAEKRAVNWLIEVMCG